MNKYGLCQNVNDEYDVWWEVWANNLTVEKIEQKRYPGFYDWFVVADGVRIHLREEIIIEEVNGKDV
jgi:hypothetical protein